MRTGEPRADADVEVLGILPDHHKVDVLRLLVRERCPDAIEEFDRPEVDELVEVKPDRKQDALLEDSGLHPGIADGPEVDRLELREVPDVLFREEFPGREVALRADVEVGPRYVEPEPLSRGVEDLFTRRHDLGTDPVSADCRYSMLHISTLSRFFA